MLKLIEKLRQKPDSTKKKIAFFSAFFFCAVIFVVWLSVVYPGFRSDQAKKEAVMKLEPSPLGTFKETFNTGVSTLKDQYAELKDSIVSVATSSIGVLNATSTVVSTSTESVE